LSDGQACRVAVKDDGWVNWMGLATFASDFQAAAATKVEHLLQLSPV
jgi:hypothetical protein